MMPSMKQHDHEILQPEQMSVSELRHWLSQFGEQNKTHFEKNRVQKGRNGKSNYSIQKRIQQLEVSLASSSESTASTESLPPARGSKDNAPHRGDRQGTKNLTVATDTSLAEVPTADHETYVTQCRSAPEPVFRQFDGEKPLAKHQMKVPSSPNEYRIVSIRKLLDSPPKATNRSVNGSISWYEDPGADDLLDAWPGSTMLWQPNFYRPFVLEEERTVQSFDEGLTDPPTTEGESEVDETIPCDASSFSDPGVPGGASSEPFHKSRSGALDPPPKRGFRSKLPLLLCKSVKETIDFEGHEVKTPPRPMSPAGPTTAVTHSPAACSPATLDDAPVRYVEPQKVVCEDSLGHHGLAGWSDDNCQSLDATMGEIFVEEMRRFDLDEKRDQGEAEVSNELNSTKGATTEEVVPLPTTTGSTKRSLACKTSSVTQAVQQFGGSGKRSAVQRRRDALERKWAQEKQPTHSKKIKWQICNGAYKKKVTLSVHK